MAPVNRLQSLWKDPRVDEREQSAWRTIVNPATGQVENQCSMSRRFLELISRVLRVGC